MSSILVIPRSVCPELPEAGIWPFTAWPDTVCWLPRDQAEQDENFLQIIPYAVITHACGDIWCYRRTGGDARLTDRHSCGVGGHVDRADERDNIASTIITALRREVAEELGFHLPASELLFPLGWIHESRTPIGRVHLGLVFELSWTAPFAPEPVVGEALHGLGFFRPGEILGNPRFELWSHLALQLIESET